MTHWSQFWTSKIETITFPANIEEFTIPPFPIPFKILNSSHIRNHSEPLGLDNCFIMTFWTWSPSFTPTGWSYENYLDRILFILMSKNTVKVYVKITLRILPPFRFWSQMPSKWLGYHVFTENSRIRPPMRNVLTAN